MSVLLAIYVFVGIAAQMQLLSIDGGLWVSIALCLAVVTRSLRSPLITASAAGTAATLVSLALVAP